MGLSYDDMFPTRFIKAGEFHGRAWTLTIKTVTREEVERSDGKYEQINVVSFYETTKLWRLNKTNAQMLKAMWGPDSDNWLRKMITLHPEEDDSGKSDSGECIRVLGSPDISAPIQAVIRLPRKKPVTHTLKVTPRPQRQNQAPAQ